MFSGTGSYSTGKMTLSLMASKSLGIDRFDVDGAVSYHLTGLWRLSYSYAADRYLDSYFGDNTVGIGYKIGWREIGLVWSESTKRFGIQFGGAAP
jgi:hypothetical protein